MKPWPLSKVNLQAERDSRSFIIPLGARIGYPCHLSAMSQIEHSDPINAQILGISEDKIEGFVREPFAEIAKLSGVGLDTVIDRIRTMLAAGTIRRVRQTLIAPRLAD